jgi:hypothetical protein
MASGQASHPAYATFTEPGFSGRFTVVAWFGDKAHVLISDHDGEAAMEVVWKLLPGNGDLFPEEGSFIVMVKDYSRRTCTVRIEEQPRPYVMWLLDAAPTSLSAQ